MLGGHRVPFLRKRSPGRAGQGASRPLGVGRTSPSCKDLEEERGRVRAHSGRQGSPSEQEQNGTGLSWTDVREQRKGCPRQPQPS